MLKSVEADSVIVYDNQDSIESLGSITLGISDNGKIQYTPNYNCCELKSATLSLIDYIGVILLPRHIPIHINSTKSIEGKIASPAYIEGDGNIDLIISPESDLELCLSTSCLTIINDEMFLPGPMNHNRYISRDYVHFENRYSEYIKSQLNNTKEGKIPNEFQSHDLRYTIQEVCKHFNLICVDKDNGLIELKYTPPKKDSLKDLNLYVKNKEYRHLEIQKMDAINSEDYKTVIQLNNKLERLKIEIQNITKKYD